MLEKMRGRRGLRVLLVLVAASLASGGCVSVAEFRKLEYQVNKLKGDGVPGGGGSDLADLALEVEALRSELSEVEGRIEVAEHRADEALAEARSARQASSGGSEAAAPAADASPAEVEAYREARAAWRAGDLPACVDRFSDFVRTYPASDHADDAAYWLADCHFKEGDYKKAILRFDDVVRGYPAGDKAPEALYRQGEALLRLGPSHGKAAEQAFQRLINEYPDSERVAEAQRQLDLLGAG
jgi:tol-pal system protein YbgF